MIRTLFFYLYVWDFSLAHNQRIHFGFLFLGFDTFSCDASYQRCIIFIGNPLGYDITDTDQQFNNESRPFIAKYSYDLPHYNAFRFH